MTRALARRAGLDLFCFTTGKAAVRYAMEHKPMVVCVFEEAVTRMTTVFFVAVRPRAGVCKFTRVDR